MLEPKLFEPLVKCSPVQKIRNGPMKYQRLAASLYGQPHLVTAAAFEQVHAAFQRILAGLPMPAGFEMPDDEEDDLYEIQPNGVAVVKIKGVLSREISALEKACGGYDLEDVAEACAKIEADPNARAVVFEIDSPGGSVTGTEEAAAAIAGMSKPTIAHTSGMAASAALWMFSQADARYVSESAQVGSVGVYMAMLDQSRRFEAEGLRQDVIKSEGSPLKAGGIPGTSLSEEQRAQLQETVDYLYARFSGAVQAAMPNVNPAALTGGMYFGSKAVEMGLADSVASLADAIRDAGTLADMRKK